MKTACEVEILAPPKLVLAVIEDFERYPELMPEVLSARVLAREARVFEVSFSLRIVRPLQYTLRLIEEDGEDGALILRWTLVEGAFRSNDGRWVLRPLHGGAATWVRYEIELRPGMFIPRVIENTLMRATLPAMLAAFKTRAERAVTPPASSAPSPGGIGPADA